ncbi:hypothetical protein KFK09_010755 [Dendrobium nobile]|uniref:Uncharacterized protein n=1 Tax=Dendrobium nobile TaxID=94219 RepID=A0A8T3BDY1_DENNO|nr:hypothetical protein KFK09_010755 [Dendrobium nobile]
MENQEAKGCVFRIQKCAFDLLSMEDDLINEEDDDIWWELIRREICLKSTFLYCDLNRVISSSADELKRTLTDLANSLFQYLEELDDAIKSRSISLAQICYSDAALVLQEIMAALIPGY